MKDLVSRWFAILWQGGGGAPSRASVDVSNSDAGSLGHHKPATFEDYKRRLNGHPDLWYVGEAWFTRAKA